MKTLYRCGLVLVVIRDLHRCQSRLCIAKRVMAQRRWISVSLLHDECIISPRWTNDSTRWTSCPQTGRIGGSFLVEPVLEPLSYVSLLLKQVARLPRGISLEHEQAAPAAQKGKTISSAKSRWVNERCLNVLPFFPHYIEPELVRLSSAECHI